MKRKPEEFIPDNQRRLIRAEAWKGYADKTIEIIERAKYANEILAAYELTFYWIAFEALFNTKMKGNSDNNRKNMQDFIRKAINVGHKESLRSELEKREKEARHLITLPVTASDFWNPQTDKESRIMREVMIREKLSEVAAIYRTPKLCHQILEGNWWARHKDDMEKLQNALKDKEFKERARFLHDGLEEVFERIHITRHQIIHGGNSLVGSRGKRQVQCAANLLTEFVPLFIKIVKSSLREKDWGEVPFPHVGEEANDPKVTPPWLKDESERIIAKLRSENETPISR